MAHGRTWKEKTVCKLYAPRPSKVSLKWHNGLGDRIGAFANKRCGYWLNWTHLSGTSHIVSWCCKYEAGSFILHNMTCSTWKTGNVSIQCRLYPTATAERYYSQVDLCISYSSWTENASECLHRILLCGKGVSHTKEIINTHNIRVCVKNLSTVVEVAHKLQTTAVWCGMHKTRITDSFHWINSNRWKLNKDTSLLCCV